MLCTSLINNGNYFNIQARVRTNEAATCSACKVTIENHAGAPRLSSSCPFCGQPYGPARPLIQEAVQASVGAGRVRSHRSSSDPLVPSFRLPPIVS